MRSQAEALYNLQTQELQILRHTKRLHEIADELSNDERVAAAQARVDGAQSKLAPQRADALNLELEIETTREKARKSEERLYSGVVTNPKELQDLQQEIASLGQRHSELEDRLLEKMMAVEEAEAELATLEQALDDAMSLLKDEQQDLLDERTALQTTLRETEERREAALKDVDGESLELYERLKPKKANQPIAAMENAHCSVCGIEQTVATQQEVRRAKSFAVCNNCGRILAEVHTRQGANG